LSIPVKCTSCGHAFRAKDKYAGREGGCPKCGEPISVPALGSGAADSTSSQARQTTPPGTARDTGESISHLVCGGCGREFTARKKAQPTQTKCVGCGAALTIPASTSHGTAAAGSGLPGNDFWDELPGDSASGGEETTGFSLAGLDAPSAPSPSAPKPPPGLARKRGGLTYLKNYPLSVLRIAGLAFAAIITVSSLLWGVLTGNLIAAISMMVQLGSFACYVTVIVKMFQNQRYGMAMFSIFGWLIGMAIVIWAMVSMFAMSETESDPDIVMIVAMLVGIALVFISGFTPYVMGWVKVNRWNLGPVMLVWTVCAMLSMVFGAIGRAQNTFNVDTVAESPPSIEDPLDPGLALPNTLNPGADNTPNGGTIKTGPHVKLGDAVYVTHEPQPGRIVDFEISVDYTFDPEKTDRDSQYFCMIETPNSKGQMRLVERGQGTLQGTFNTVATNNDQPNNPQQNVKKAGSWRCWVEIKPRDPHEPRSQTSEAVIMRQVDKLPQPKENIPLAPPIMSDSSSPKAPHQNPPGRSKPSTKLPPKEIDLDAALSMLDASEKREVKSALRWFRDHLIDKSRRGEVAERLARLLEHPDDFARRDAAELLRSYATAEQIPQLIGALQDESPRVRSEVRDTLAGIADSRAAKAIAGLIDTDRNGAIGALRKMGPEAENAVIGLLGHPNPIVRKDAAEILGKIGARPAMEALKELEHDRSGLARMAAEKAFYQIEFRLEQQDRRPTTELEPVTEP